MTPRDEAVVDIFFPLFVRDWLTGDAFAFSNRQRGAMVQLMCHAWLQQATLPADPGAIGKYADEAREWLDTPEGAAVLEQWPVVQDTADPAYGRRRNARLWTVYTDAVERREKAQRAAKVAAEARWGNRPPQAPPQPQPAAAEPPPKPAKSSAPQFAEAINGLPPLIAWVAESRDNEAALRRMLSRVLDLHGAGALRGFCYEINSALEGLNMPRLQPRTSSEVRKALEDWCDTDKAGSKNSFRAYLNGSRPARERYGAPRRAENPRGSHPLYMEE